ncbi:hypothetical protein GFL62_01600 [Rhizobium leguminosarum bv. viciae]|nr:hypothetical protein [Rhizobium leguminosarum bv. viciae]TCA03705.1 hypothetical protein E0H57_18755 [Rhizobium leguminosarum bv. viciae]
MPFLGLRPRDVTGIQPPRVCAVIDSIKREVSFAPKDLDALDSCDEHRNEGKRVACVMRQSFQPEWSAAMPPV